MHLSDEDFRSLETCYVSREYAEAAGLRRVDSLEGRERMGRKGASDYSGILFPYRDPVTREIVGERLRLDNPPVGSNGKPEHKYLSPPGQRNHAYMPLASPEWLKDVSLPILIGEGEKKYLAAHRFATEHAKESGRLLFFAVTFPGVWCWRGGIGVMPDKNGKRVPQKGVIPDIDRIVWEGRRVTICYDSNVNSNGSVRAARSHLARELMARGAEVYFIDLPQEAYGAQINGLDDLLGIPGGPKLFEELYRSALRWDWTRELIRNAKGKVLPLLSNALLALRLAPELRGMLGFNEFALRIEIRRETPWNHEVGLWSDYHQAMLRAYLEKLGIVQSAANIAEAVPAAAKENVFHPVRSYLDTLTWDGVGRVDDWLTLYLGVEQSDYVRTVGAKWMISAVARIFEPGCKADHALILEGEQGVGKSRTLQILGGEYYSDDIAELGTKDAALGVGGVWILELSELDAMTRADVTKIKSFISRSVDRYRPPYARYVIEAPRQCVFAGSVNHTHYLKDETGDRRFWPVTCGREIRIEQLARDRGQLWAEAVARYRKGESWWIEDKVLIKAASGEQEARYQSDPWQQTIADYLFSRTEVTVEEILCGPLKKEIGQWTPADNKRVGGILTHLKWDRITRPRSKGPHRPRTYHPSDPTKSA